MSAMQTIDALEAAARRTRGAIAAALGEAERSPLVEAIESYARTEALLFAQALIAAIAARLATGLPAPAEIGPLLAEALAATAANLSPGPSPKAGGELRGTGVG